MKKVAISIFLILAFWGVVAQEDSMSWKREFPRHDLQFGIGDPLIAGLSIHYLSSINHWFNGDDAIAEVMPVDEIYSSETYFGDLYTSGCFSISYHYRLKKWLWVGATCSYVGFWSNVYDKFSDQKVASNQTHLFFVIPSVRFSWLNKKYVMLYSGLSLGIGTCYINSYDKFYASNSSNLSLRCVGELTAVGVHVGRAWYGFAELGLGSQGFAVIGFGYQFKNRKK